MGFAGGIQRGVKEPFGEDEKAADRRRRRQSGANRDSRSLGTEGRGRGDPGGRESPLFPQF
jgi:hypothetical protein